MTGTDIRLNIERGIALVTIARAPVNAFTIETYRQLRKTFTDIAENTDVRVAILTGEGKTFCAGNDVSGFLEQTYDDTIEELAIIRTSFNALQDCPVPVIAAVNGAALGTGIVLTALCDIRVASERAFFALPEISVGAMGGAKHVMRMAPQGMARLMAFTGRRVSAEEALRVNMVEKVVAHDSLMAEALEIAEQIANQSPTAIRLAKVAANRVETMHLKEAYEYECSLMSSLRMTEESQEAARAFMEKRTPAFVADRG